MQQSGTIELGLKASELAVTEEVVAQCCGADIELATHGILISYEGEWLIMYEESECDSCGESIWLPVTCFKEEAMDTIKRVKHEIESTSKKFASQRMQCPH